MKTWLVVGLVIVFSVVLSPVIAAEPDLAVGGKIGANIGWFSGDDWDDLLEIEELDNKARVGISAAAFLEIGLFENFAVQPEIGVSSRRGGAGDTIGGVDVDLIAKSTAIDIAVLAKPRIAVGNGFLYGLIGPQLFWLIGDSEFEGQVDGDTVFTEKEEPDNRLLFGVAVGAGYSHPVGPGSIVGDVVYTRAFNSPEDDFDIFFNGVAVKVGYQIGL